jgi:hypothetical protein
VASPTSSRVFIAAIELLEAFEYHSKTFTSSNWEWVFETVIPFLALSIVLTELPRANQQSDIDRAQWQINLNFQRFSDPSKLVSGTPMWKLLVQLRENMETSQTPSQQNQSSAPLADGKPLEIFATMTFSPGLISDSEFYTAGTEDFLYEDQFMQDLPW